MALRKKLFTALIGMICILALGSTGYRILTDASWFDCLYMTTITLSTVGYGEVIAEVEHNQAARIFTMFLIFTGIGVLMYVLSISTAFLVEGELSEILRRRKMEKRIAALRRHYIVCGAGSTGVHIINELQQTGRDFVIIDENREVIDRVNRDQKFLYIAGDAALDETLMKAGVDKAVGLMAVLPGDKDNLFVTITARQLNPGIRIISKTASEGCESKMRTAGADAVVDTHRIGALRIVSEMVRPTVVTFLDRMLRERGEAFRFEELRVPAGSKWIGKTARDLDLHKKFRISLVALKQPDADQFSYNPRPEETLLKPNTTLVILGDMAHVKEARVIVEAI